MTDQTQPTETPVEIVFQSGFAKPEQKAPQSNNDWLECSDGQKRWGREGASGILLTSRAHGTRRYLLTQRAHWVDEGLTWGIPSGAIDPGEGVATAAQRELEEECGIRLQWRGNCKLLGIHHAAPCDNWAFTTLMVDVPKLLVGNGSDESVGMGWFTAQEIGTLNLHPALRQNITKFMIMMEYQDIQQQLRQNEIYAAIEAARQNSKQKVA